MLLCKSLKTFAIFQQVAGTHLSEDEPPNVPYFMEEVQSKKSTKAFSIAESVAAAVSATMTAFNSQVNSQLPANTFSKVSYFNFS